MGSVIDTAFIKQNPWPSLYLRLNFCSRFCAQGTIEVLRCSRSPFLWELGLNRTLRKPFKLVFGFAASLTSCAVQYAGRPCWSSALLSITVGGGLERGLIAAQTIALALPLLSMLSDACRRPMNALVEVAHVPSLCIYHCKHFALCACLRFRDEPLCGGSDTRALEF